MFVSMEPNGIISNPLAIGWTNLTRRKARWSKKLILDNLTGRLNFGEVTALMGPSGAGKTTLLRCINGLDRSTVGGETMFYASRQQQLRVCFIKQDSDEHLLRKLTCKESLIYSSLLKNSGSRDFDHVKNVQVVIELLSLNDCVDTMTFKCSGGQRKRLSIGLELTGLVKPNLMCLDEPTSGLDSEAAEQIIACLHHTAKQNKSAIVASVHQPSVDVMMMFDQLYVLSITGRCVYSGPPDKISQHLNKCQINYQEWQVPIEVLIRSVSKREYREIETLVYKTDEELRKFQFEIEYGVALSRINKNKASFNFSDFYQLLCRETKNTWSNHLSTFAILIFGILVLMYAFPKGIGQDPDCPLVITSENITKLNEQIKDVLVGDNPKAVQNFFYLFQTTFFVSAIIAVSSVFIFPADFKVFLTEHRNGWYSSSAYFFSKCLAQLPVILIMSYALFWLVYFGKSQPDLTHWHQGLWNMPERFKLFQMVISLLIANSFATALAISILFSQTWLAIIGLAIVMHLQMFFCGVFFPLRDLDVVHKIVALPNYYRLTLNSLLIIIYGERCEEESTILTKMDVAEDELWDNFEWLSILCGFWFVFSFIMMYFKVKLQ